jgi:tRNA(Ile)-lysidine synthase TilS/MesJ
MSKTEQEMIKDLYLDCDESDLKSLCEKHNIVYESVEKIVEKPKHYDIGIDTFTRMRANATFEEAMGFIRWNIDKYNTRAKGQDEEDYKKIEAYCKEALWWFVNKRAKE